ncbi:MAG: cation:proton antiporter [Gammaproteobacteria bacterium]|nr:cation:proton antiporter [Gammaproteobacteria bacterium]
MDLNSIAIIVAGFLLFALFSGRLQGTVLTAPLVFIVFGYLVGAGGLGVAQVDPGNDALHLVAELTLILVLFSDAARIDLGSLRRDHNLPLRMLVVGLPLVMLTGAVLAAVLFPEFAFWEAALLAALLAPTDAALGQSVVSAREVPVRIRQAINVESGLNDGIALPAVLLFAALASASHADTDAGEWLQFGLLQITLGPVTGAIVGMVGGRVLDRVAEKQWAATSFQGIAILALALLCFVLAEMLGGNGFIAAFVGGVAFGNTIRHPCTFLFEFMETEGQLLMLITFMVFGAALLPKGLQHIDGSVVFYALMSLTVIRMLPVAVSLFRTGVGWPTRLFLGWFGPRGIASILFGLLILEEMEVANVEKLFAITIVTVALSALLHGVTAAPLARLYGRKAAAMGECEENRVVTELPLREGMQQTQDQPGLL